MKTTDCSQCKTLFSPCKWNVTTIVPLTNAYEINHIWELQEWNQMKNEWSSQLWTQFMQLHKKPENKKIRTSTGFEPVTSQYRCDALTNYPMKPLIVLLFSNPENNGLQSVCSLHFLLSTNLYIKDQQGMDIFIFFFF